MKISLSYINLRFFKQKQYFKLVKKYNRSQITMIFQTFLIISILIAAHYSAKIDEKNNKYEELSNIDCDRFHHIYINTVCIMFSFCTSSASV